MTCTNDCDQGRRCTCGPEYEQDPAREFLQDIVDWAGVIAGVFMATAVIGFLVGFLWVWL